MTRDLEKDPVHSPDLGTGYLTMTLTRLESRMERIEVAMEKILQRQTVKDYYTTGEIAAELNRAEFTVREWCRLGRLAAQKRVCGRGLSQEWIVSHAELERYRSHGLLPQHQ